METKLTPFLFEGEAMVRAIERDGAPWFVLGDICVVLEIANPTRAASRLDADELALHTVKGESGEREMNIISESGLYSLTLTSRKPSAKRFKKWITSEVLPSLRKTGTYTMPGLAEVQPPLRPKPFDEWTLEEIRTHLSVANGYRHTLNNASAAWYLMREGFPRPPERLMPAWWQSDLNLNRGGEGRSVVVVSVPNGDGSH